MKRVASVMRGLTLAFCAVLLIVGSLFISAAPAAADTVKVKMGTAKGLVFDPKVVTAKPGDTLEFTVGNLPPHNVIFDGALADVSHKALEGAKKSFTVDIPAGTAPGTYNFFCAPHKGAGMAGKLVVQ